jgi:hypothetical protein
MVYPRNICVNTLHKGDSIFTNNNNNNNTKEHLCQYTLQFHETEILLKTDNTSIYKDLTLETQRKWNVKAEVMPVETGATGTISESFRKYPSNIPGKHIKETQKTVTFGDCGHA